jgi:YidC/Oxa1 family membrane protein insertase
VNKKQRNLLLVAVLLLAAVVLSGCAIPQGPIDLNSPPGAWERFVVYPLAQLLMGLNNFLAGLGFAYSWGWAIIIFTVIVKIGTLPLTLKQLQSTKAQQQLQPKLRELQEKYGKDRQKLAEEQMKLYKEYGVNPMGGCLPLLVQLPILWGLYQALYILANPSIAEQTQFIGAEFYWIPDLSYPSLTVGTSWIGEAFQAQDWGKLFAYFSLPVLMLVTQMLVQKMAQPKKVPGQQQDAQMRMMNQMMLFMPIMFGWITLGLPSGLTLYWTTSNILAIIQQYFVTGWGGLGDWFPFLSKGQQPALAGASAGSGSRSATSAGVNAGSSSISSVPAASETPEKPVKRRKRRR